jgi:signal transduction histidine kinase
VEARTERLERQLDVLGTGAAIEARTLELKFERVNLVPLVNQVVARSRSRGTPHKLNIAMPQGLTALVDPQRIDQVVQALLDHALARCPRGCWIDVDLRRPLVGLARLEVRDFGRSVPERVRQRLRDGGGSDRGLALVRSIVELHGGTLGFEFPDDGGVRAVVTLPTQRGRVLGSGT